MVGVSSCWITLTLRTLHRMHVCKSVVETGWVRCGLGSVQWVTLDHASPQLSPGWVL